MISSRKNACARALFFVSSPTASGVQPPFETNSIWIFSTSILSFFTVFSRTRDRRLASKIRLSTLQLVAVDRLTSFGSVRRRCTKAPRKQPMRGIESSASKRTSWNPGGHHFRHLSTGPCLHCVTVHCLATRQGSLTSPRKGTTSLPSTKTERAVQGSPHNACIP